MKLINFLTLLISFGFVNSFQCRNEQNETVDWYVLYKLPKIKESSRSLIKSGTAYMFMTSESVAHGWALSNKSINESKSIPGLTLNPLYKDSSALYVLYNDEPPNGESTSKGHTKGVLLVNRTNGIWLIHSVPHYPSPKHYVFPKSGTHYGQSFLCISVNIETIDTIGKQLFYNGPFIYSYNFPKNLTNQLPYLYEVVNNKTVQTAPWYHASNFSSLGMNVFQSFAKSKNFNKELYADWVAPALHSNLSVETWQNGPGKLPSDCSKKFKIRNIQNIFIPKANLRFSSTKDHSKWAIEDNLKISTPWVCIGDINRAEHQKVRGGGSVCFENFNVWSNYKQIINVTESCPNTLK